MRTLIAKKPPSALSSTPRLPAASLAAKCGTVTRHAAPRTLHCNPDASGCNNHPVAQFAHDFSRIPVHARRQPALVVSRPGDVCEQEAERVAAQVMRLQAPLGWDAMAAKSASVGIEVNRSISQALTLPREDKVRAQPIIFTKALPGSSCDSAPSGEEEQEKNRQSVMRKSTSSQ